MINIKSFYVLQLFFCVIISQKPFETNEFGIDICEANERRHYLELGTVGTLFAKRVTSLKNNTFEKNSFKKCSIEFTTCPSCVVKVSFRFLNISRYCHENTLLDTCNCNMVWIYEPHFKETSGKQYCGHYIINVKSNDTDLLFISKTKSLRITFIYVKDFNHAFTLEYLAKRNTEVINIYSNFKYTNRTQEIMTPYFPEIYPRDLMSEYEINCFISRFCKINLIFTDYLISKSSIVEIFDWNGQRMYVSTGEIFRPPLLTSSGPKLTVKFYANGGSNLGFKAFYTLLPLITNSNLIPDLDCGGNVNNLGGGITMMNMISEGKKSYDCIWLVRAPGTYMQIKTHLYVKVITFDNFGGNTELIIRQGITSNDDIIEILRHPLSQIIESLGREHIVPISKGFYIRLKGIFNASSKLAIVYAAFNYKDCFAGSDFLCENLRCISVLLRCDGFDHCGDRSDEENNCILDPEDRRNWTRIPKFLFPPSNDDSLQLTNTTIIFLVVSFGLLGTIFGIALYFYRANLQAINRLRIQDHMETIQAILDEGINIEVVEDGNFSDDPPTYEAPPNYDELDRVKSCRKRRKSRRIKRSASSRTTNSNQEISNEVASIGIASSSSVLQLPQTPPPAYSSTGDVSQCQVVHLTSTYLQGLARFPFYKNKLISTKTSSCAFRRAFSESDISAINEPTTTDANNSNSDIMLKIRGSISLNNLSKL